MYNVEGIFELRKSPKGNLSVIGDLIADMVDDASMLRMEEEDAPYLYQLKFQSLKLCLLSRERTLLLLFHSIILSRSS